MKLAQVGKMVGARSLRGCGPWESWGALGRPMGGVYLPCVMMGEAFPYPRPGSGLTLPPPAAGLFPIVSPSTLGTPGLFVTSQLF